MNVTFYTFSKRVNSTARPTGGTDYTVILKEPSSVISPRLDLIWTGTGSPTAFNYAYIGDFGRYYWVANWEYHDRKWTASLTVDVLASWKTEIGAAEKYVLRSASLWDNDVFDNFYPATGDERKDVVSVSSGWTTLLASGFYVSSVSGYDNQNAALGVALFQQTPAQADEMLKLAYDDLYSIINNQTQVTDVQTAVQWLGESTIKATSDLWRYINSIMWFPFNFEATTGTPVDIYLGLLESGKGLPLILGQRAFNYTLTLPSWALDDPKWKFCEPYTFYTLEFMPFGTIRLDSLALVNAGSVFLNVTVDAFTGVGILKVFAGSDMTGQLLAVRSAQVGIPVQIGGQAVDLGGALQALTSGIRSMGDPAGTALAASSGIVSAELALVGDAFSAGRTGNIAAIGDTIYLRIRRLMPTDEDPIEYGQPLCSVEELSDLSGFILCRDGDISAPATQGELDQIAAYLTGGFFYD